MEGLVKKDLTMYILGDLSDGIPKIIDLSFSKEKEDRI